MLGDHALSPPVIERTLDGRACAECICGWSTGWRRNRHAALRAVGDHVDRCNQPMTVERAKAILTDHQHGLHADHDDGEGGCEWIDCERAYFFMADRAEEYQWLAWQALEERRRAVDSKSISK